MLGPTDDEIAEARARVQERIAVRAETRLPVLDYDQTVAAALSALAMEKEQIVFRHWKDRLWRRYHRRIEKRIARKLARPFRFTPISGHAVRPRWLAVLERFVRRDVERRFGRHPVSLAEVRRAYHDEHQRRGPLADASAGGQCDASEPDKAAQRRL